MDQVYDFQSWNDKFKFKLQVLDWRYELKGREKFRVKSTISKFNDVTEEYLQKSSSVRFVNAALLKDELKRAFNKAPDVA